MDQISFRLYARKGVTRFYFDSVGLNTTARRRSLYFTFSYFVERRKSRVQLHLSRAFLRSDNNNSKKARQKRRTCTNQTLVAQFKKSKRARVFACTHTHTHTHTHGRTHTSKSPHTRPRSRTRYLEIFCLLFAKSKQSFGATTVATTTSITTATTNHSNVKTYVSCSCRHDMRFVR